MMAYGPRIVVQDRWAIICYLRALQRSQHATAADVPPDHQADLEKKERSRKRNERSIPSPARAGRRIFRKQPLCRVVAALRLVIGIVGRRAELRRRRIDRRCNSAIPGFSPLSFSSRSASAVSSGRSCTMWSTRSGPSLSGDSSKTSRSSSRCWVSSLCRSGSGENIFTAGWISPLGVDPLLDAKRAYLNWEFFFFRAIFFFVALTIVAYLAAAVFRPPGSRRQSAVHDLDAQGGLHRSAAFRALPDLWRLRLGDEPELALVLDHVGSLYFCRDRGQLDGAARPGHRGPAAGRLSEGAW